MTGADFLISNGFWAVGSPECSYLINPSGASVLASGGTGSVAVTSSVGCAWTASTASNWISITGGTSGTGNGTVNYSVAVNSSQQQRVGTIIIGGQTFTITQAGTATSNCVTVSLPTNSVGAVNTTITVPVSVTDLTNRQIDAYDFTVQFNSSVIVPAATPVDTAGTLSSSMSVVANSPANGKLVVSAAGVGLLSGQGTLLYLKFNVVGAAQSNSALTWQQFQFGDGDPCANLIGGQVTVTSGALNGVITYGTTPFNQATKYVRGVNLTAAGAPEVNATTDLNGAYRLANLGTGAYTVTPTKTGDVNGVNSTDAARIQQHLVSLITLTSNQLLAADVNNSGTVNSTDAARIQQYLVRLQTTIIIGQWKFIAPSKQYASVTTEQTGEDYQAILVGDVNGSWIAPTSVAGREVEDNEEPNSLLDSLYGNVVVSLPNSIFAGAGSTVEVPINVGDLTGKNVDAFDFTIFYNHDVLRPSSTAFEKAGTLSSNFSVVANSPADGKLVVSAAGVNPMTGQGTLLKLRFNVVGQGGQQSSLTFTNIATNQNTFTFVDGDPAAVTNVGQFAVTGPTAAGATVSGRISLPAGNIFQANVTLTDSHGEIRTALVSQSGDFRFEDVAAGETYILNASTKRYAFAPQILTVIEDITDLVLTPIP